MTGRPGSFVRFPSLVLAGILAIAAAVACPAAAQEGPPTPPSPVSTPQEGPLVPASPEPTPQEGPPVPASPEPTTSEKLVEEKASGVMMAVDESHARLERGILDRVIRFDNFFGSVKGDDVRYPDYLIRWVNSLRMEEGGNFKYRTSARASFVLPKIGKRLRLVVSGETEPEPFSAKLPEDPGNPGFDRTLANTRLVNTEIRYSLIHKPTVDMFLGTGVRIKSPLESFVRSRFQYSHRLGEVTLARFAETVFWKNTEGFGETTEIELSRQLGPKTLLRWGNAGTVTEEGPGVEWATELSLLRELSRRSAITIGGGLSGHTRPASQVDIYRVFTRYRRNFLRTWLFFELEPEVSWPRDLFGEYPLTYAFTFRIEVVFQGTAAMTKKPPGAP
jgi:hypothetical protein